MVCVYNHYFVIIVVNGIHFMLLCVIGDAIICLDGTGVCNW